MKMLRNYSSILLGILFFSLAGTTAAQKTDTYNLDETYEISENGTIELHSNDAGLVDIRGSDRNQVRLIVTYRLEVDGLSIGKQDKFDMEVAERNGDLIIRETADEQGLNLNLGSVTKKYTITILAPRDANLDLYGDDDTYEITDMDGSIRIDSDDGEMYLRNCRGGEFHFDYDDGELVMDSGSGRLVLNVDDGEADVRNGRFDEVDITSADGDINLSTSLAEGGNYNVGSDDGDIDLTILDGGGEFRVEHDDIRISAGPDFEQVERNENFTRYRLPGGSARVRIETDNGGVRFFTR
ncbi:DUF4097 family beta strand repeat-containing protein [Halalkalibaculum sp. DA3122]|uniref:DUF4097 family beta strand repeat-containing protein n=1 Tax=unclassified Halalkalibaculum TaxID=2964617 RepID=UPI003754DEDC